MAWVAVDGSLSSWVPSSWDLRGPGVSAIHELQAAHEGEDQREDGEDAVVDARRDGAHADGNGDHAEAQGREVHAVGAVRPAVQALLLLQWHKIVMPDGKHGHNT